MDVVKKVKTVKEIEKLKSDISEAKSSNNESKLNTKWSNRDKRMLLKALQKYGSENIEGISTMLPSIPLEDIKSKISEYSEMAKDLYKNELLDQWLDCGLYQPEDSFIAEALLFIQLFEDHPSLSQSGGYDIRAIYKYLYRSCFEQTSYFDLSPKDRDLLCFLLSKVEQKVWPQCKTDIWEYVGKVYNKRHIKKVYPGKKENSS